MFEYKIHNSFEEINSITNLFSETLPTSNVNQLFGDFFWMDCYSKILAKDEIYIICSYKNDILKTILPFQKNGNTLTTLCDHKTDYNTIFIGENVDMESLIIFLQKQNISEIHLKNIIKDHEKFIPNNIELDKTYCPLIRLNEKRNVDLKTIKELKTNRDKIELIGKIKHEIISTKPYLTDIFLHLHKSWWNAKAQSGLFSESTDKHFLNQILSNFNNRKKSFYSIIYINNVIASMLLFFKLNDSTIGYYLGGHNLTFKKYQIGLVHIDTLIKYYSTNLSFSFFDFLRGTEPYKIQLGAMNDNYVFNCSLSVYK